MKKKTVLIVLLVVVIIGLAFFGQWYADKKHNEAVVDTVLDLETQTFDLGEGVKLEMVRIPEGTYKMGTAYRLLSILPGSSFFPSTKKVDMSERYAHSVELSEFWIGKYEVTQEQYEAVMGENPSTFKGAKNPVERVSRDDMLAFCKTLSVQTGTSFTLPTEAQWEYACRAESTTEYNFGNDVDLLEDYAWYKHNSGGMTHPVGQKKPNHWGLYDMHGNVFERCRDYYNQLYYRRSEATMKNPENTKECPFVVIRGGSWMENSRYSRSAFRDLYDPGERNKIVGFRIVWIQP